MFGAHKGQLEDELLRERQLNCDFLEALNQALDLARQQHELIVGQRQLLELYSSLIDTQVKPALELFLQQKGTQ